MSEATFRVGPYTGHDGSVRVYNHKTKEYELRQSDDAYRNTSVTCNWCGSRVKWLALGDHMEGHHASQRIYRPLPSCKRLSPADAMRVNAEWQGRDATDEEVES